MTRYEYIFNKIVNINILAIQCKKVEVTLFSMHRSTGYIWHPRWAKPTKLNGYCVAVPMKVLATRELIILLGRSSNKLEVANLEDDKAHADASPAYCMEPPTPL